MALQNRLSRLENIHTAAQAKRKVAYQSSEEARQWLHNVIQSINERRRLIDKGIIEDTYTPQPRTPLPPDASPSKIWLNDRLNEMEMLHEHKK
jgi:hypothetical protein